MMSVLARTATVYVVDDDASVCRALSRLVRSAGMEAVAFESLASLLAAEIRREDACVIADVQLDDEDGLALPRLLAERGLELPVIVVTAVDSPDLRDRVLRAGAAAFFRKPVDDQALIDTIRWVLAAQSGRRGR